MKTYSKTFHAILKQINLLWLVCLVFVVTVCGNFPMRANAQEMLSRKKPQSVTLQLRWKHQFQFAGYYAAIKKGFYQRAGLLVTLEEGGIERDVVEEVLANRTQYGVTNSELLLHRLNGKPLVVLAAIFQHSPLTLVSRDVFGIRDLHDLIGRRVKMTVNSRDIELHAMFLNEGIALDSLNIVDGSTTTPHFFDDSISAVSAYLTNEPYYYETKGISYRLFHPRTYGVDFYGDCLFTSQQEIENHPQRVEAFLQASLEGWEYALRNPEEIIETIISDYRVEKTKEHLRYEAGVMRELIMPDLVEIGHINPGRWQHIAETFNRYQLIGDDYSLDGFIYQRGSKTDLKGLYWTLGTITVIGALIGLTALTLFRLNRRLKKEISERKQAEAIITKERDFLNSILRWIESIVVVIDLNGYIVRYNQAAEKACGYSLSEVQQKPFWDILVRPEERESVKNIILNVKTKALPLENDNYWESKTGQLRYIHWFNSVLYGPDGTIEYVLCTGLDLTERSEIEYALQRSEEHYQSILGNMEEGYFEVDLKGNFIAANHSLIESLGYPQSELIGLNFRNVMAEKTSEYVFSMFHQVYNTRKPLNLVSYDIIRKNGIRRTVEVSTSLILDANKEPEGFYGIARDVTERKRMEEMMIQTEKMMSVGGLAAGMAHEINNPLAVIVQGVQNIKRRLSPAEKKNREAAEKTKTDLDNLNAYLNERGIPKMLDNIQTAGERAAAIIANMLRFSRKSDFQLTRVEVESLIERSLELASKDYNLTKRHDFRQISIDLQIEKNIPAIQCMEQEIEQVILNILGNAAQAMHDATPPADTPKIIIRASREENRVRLEIKDNGPGIDEDIQHRIFEPFFTTKPLGSGTGLGLSVSYMIITNNHKGTLEVRSTAGEGSTFIITLPISQTEN